jgi:hypothetical protein
MPQPLRALFFAALLCTPIAVGLASAAHGATNCKPGAIEKLRAASADGFAIYQEIKDKKFFLTWITCDDVQLDLPTAVHESVHFITAQKDAFPLVKGGEISRPHDVSGFFPPQLIAAKFKSSPFVSSYLRPGGASSASDFLYLLDELNAYTHDLNAAIDLKDMRRGGQQVDSRDGLAAAMAFVALYVQRAEESEPATWSGLQKPQAATTLSALWGQAEKVMASSCGIPNFGTEDRRFIGQFCDAKPQSSLQKILGRPPVCPTECLNAPSTLELADDDEVDMTPTGSVSGQVSGDVSGRVPALRPFWSRSSRTGASRARAQAPRAGRTE